MAGIRTAKGVPLPRVKGVRLELAYKGVLDTRGLPLCSRARLRARNPREAISLCGSALVGQGHLYARIFLPGQLPFGLHAKLLAFNGKTSRGRTSVWVLAYSPHPPVSFILPFHVRREPGPFPTVLVSVIPRNVGPWPHFAQFGIVISRRFRHQGRVHSYLSASCPLPPRFTSGLLSLARATFTIADGPDAERWRRCAPAAPAEVPSRVGQFIVWLVLFDWAAPDLDARRTAGAAGLNAWRLGDQDPGLPLQVSNRRR